MEEYTPSIGSTFVMTFDPFLPLCCGSRVTKMRRKSSQIFQWIAFACGDSALESGSGGGSYISKWSPSQGNEGRKIRIERGAEFWIFRSRNSIFGGL